MMIPVFFFFIGVIKARLRCLYSPTDKINFPWKHTSKYFHKVFLMPLYSIYSSYLKFLQEAFSFTCFFRSFCFSHGKLITSRERVVNVYIRVYFRYALIGRFLTARLEGRHSKFKAMRAGFHSTPSPSPSESLLDTFLSTRTSNRNLVLPNELIKVELPAFFALTKG